MAFDRGLLTRCGAVAAAAACVAVLSAGAAAGQEGAAAAVKKEAVAPEEAAGGAGKLLRGTTLTYRNAFTALSLDESQEPTYNPWYAMVFEAAPKVWLSDVFYAAGLFNVSREITNSDTTTQRGEWEPGDAAVTLGAEPLVVVPWAEIGVSPAVTAAFPTSKLSRARNMYAALTPQLTLSRTFDLLAGLNLSVVGAATRYFNEYTTSENESPLIAGCVPSQWHCEAFLNSGVRNPAWRLAGQAAVSQDFFPWLGVALSAGLVQDLLYEQEEKDERISYMPQEGADTREYMVFGAELYVSPLPVLSIGAGAATESPQLTPESTPEKPVFNRYSVFYVDLRFKVDGLVSQLTSMEDGHE